MTSRRIQIDKNLLRLRAGELRQALGGAIREAIPVLVGNPDSESVYVDENTQTEIYVHDDGDTISGVSVISASGIDKKYIIYKQPIKVRLNNYGVYEFAGIDSQADSIYSAGNTDKQTQEPVHLNQLDYGTIQPYSGLQIFVKGASYGDDYVNDIIADAFDGTADDTSAASISPPTTNNRQIAVLVQMDASTGTLEFKQSSAYSAAINRFNARANSLLPAKDASRFRVGYVFLKTGATTITTDDIWNDPELITGGNSGAPTDATYIVQTASGVLSNEQAIDALSDGVLKHSSGVLAQAVENTDYAAAIHASRHAQGAADEINGDGLDSSYSAANWSAVSGTILGQWQGLDTALGSLGGAVTEIIAPTALGSSQTTISLTSIPDTYQDLKLVIKGKSTTGSTLINITFNSDTGNSYGYNYTQWNNTPTQNNIEGDNQVDIDIPAAAASSTTANYFGHCEIYINAYANAGVTRNGYWHAGYAVSANNMYRSEGFFNWENVANAITSIQINLSSGDFDTGTTYALYGIGTAT